MVVTPISMRYVFMRQLLSDECKYIYIHANSKKYVCICFVTPQDRLLVNVLSAFFLTFTFGDLKLLIKLFDISNTTLICVCFFTYGASLYNSILSIPSLWCYKLHTLIPNKLDLLSDKSTLNFVSCGHHFNKLYHFAFPWRSYQVNLQKESCNVEAPLSIIRCTSTETCQTSIQDCSNFCIKYYVGISLKYV